MYSIQSSELLVEIDPSGGADILAVTDRHTSIDVLFSTPWRLRAEQTRAGAPAASEGDSLSAWMERYRGGWQLLFPHAGPESLVDGCRHGFHGEASRIDWNVLSAAESSLVLVAEFVTVPVTVVRTIRVDGPRIIVGDVVSNLSPVTIDFDYVQHPAFGGAFLEGECTIEAAASRFTADPESETVLPAGLEQPWPLAKLSDGTIVDLSVVPGSFDGALLFGWLSSFDRGLVAIRNRTLGLSVEIDWDATVLPYAWVWADFGATAGWPWFGRARVLAVEPSSTITSGSNRRRTLSLAPHEEREFTVGLSVRRDEHG